MILDGTWTMMLETLYAVSPNVRGNHILRPYVKAYPNQDPPDFLGH